MFELAHVHATVDFLVKRIGYDLLFLQGVTVVLTVGVYAGERIVHLIASLLLLTVSDTVGFRVDLGTARTRRCPVKRANTHQIHQACQ
ncbi:hypothetical protein D3C75_716460 [compost metagenome]